MHAPVPPLTFNCGGSTADLILDRLALHLRARLPDAFGDKTLDEISLIFSDLRDEIERVLEACTYDEEED
jgi:hypothetical protein